MIARAASLVLVAYLLGFMLFAFTLGVPAPADAPPADAAVVLTGGEGRIEHAMAALKAGKVKRVLIAGADPVVTKNDMARRLGEARLVRCCVDLGSESVDTRSNAEEAARWMDKHGYKSMRLVTSDWHMRRSRYEFRKVLGDRYAVTTDAVRSRPGLLTLFAEYNKFVLRRLAVWTDL